MGRICPVALLALIIAGPSVADEPGVMRRVCAIPENGGGCVLDLGEVQRGDVVDVRARVRNLGSIPITLVVVDPRSICFPSYQRIPVPAGDTASFAVGSLDTYGFKGPISKAFVFTYEPEVPLQVTFSAANRTEADRSR